MDHRQALPDGYILGDYRIEGLLGHGGFGITYLATETASGEQFAIKEYLPREVAMREQDSSVQPVSDADQEVFDYGLERFLQEGQALVQFDHPNIVRVRRYFEDNGTAYLVMDYEDGEPLSHRIRYRKGLDEGALRAILDPLLDALERVHRSGMLHRDIKPDNIYVRDDGSPVLLDFGAARHALGERSRNLTSIVTAGYASQEQYFSGGNQGPWSDIYSLAATMYRAVTGDRPPEAPARMRDDPIRPAARVARRRYSAPFLAAIDAGLRFHEEERPQSIREWRAMFRAAGAPPPARQSGRGGRIAAIVGGLLLAVVAAGGAAWWTWGGGGGVAAGTAPPGECDRLAADPWDPDNPAAGVPWPDLDPVRSVAACEIAYREYPDSPRIQAWYGRALYRADRDEEAVVLFREAIEAGQVSAQFNLGDAYRGGWGVELDYDLALHWYRRAAAAGHAGAENQVGYMYHEGFGVGTDYDEAVMWYRRSALQGNPVGMWNLADMYEFGKSVEQSWVEAFFWYGLAAKYGDVEAPARATEIEARLTAEDISGVQQRAAAWTPARTTR